MGEQDAVLKELTVIREEQQAQRQLLEEVHTYVKGVRRMGRARLVIYALILLFSFASVYLYYRTIVNMFSM